MKKINLFAASVVTLFVFPAVAFVVGHFSDTFDYFSIFPKSLNFLNILIGLVSGLVASGLGILLLKIDLFKNIKSFYAEIFADVDIKTPDIIFYSLCAGIGEEIFFRGMLQEFFGIWPVAIFFVLIHGYLNFKDWKKSIYGVFLILISAGFGYLYHCFDIYAAILAHAIYDVFMFKLLIKTKSNQN